MFQKILFSIHFFLPKICKCNFFTFKTIKRRLKKVVEIFQKAQWHKAGHKKYVWSEGDQAADVDTDMDT